MASHPSDIPALKLGLLALLALALPAQGGDRMLRNVAPGRPLPALELEGVDGDTVSLSSYRGKALVLVFVRKDQSRSLRALRALQQERKNLPGPVVAILAVAPGEDVSDWARKVKAENELHFPFALDSKRQAYARFGVIASPTTFIADRKGIVRYVLPGLPPRYGLKVRLHARLCGGLIDQEAHDAEVARESLPASQEERALRTRLGLCRALIKKGHTEKAQSILQTLIKEHPAEPRVAILLSELLLGQGRVDEATATLAPLADRKPRSGDLLLALSHLAAARGDKAGARTLLEEGAEREAAEPALLYALGRIYEEEGRKDDALKAYRRALEGVLGR